ncbi:OmpA family protein [Chitinophaga japonensis]|uniref:OmpA family protein n=1 Tax=Chitinophaga japonensis TaxID=104662 RepID=A0A562TG19_CHIJA|nr:OmpA family protein [Chitinophaga japonensis]TWI92198.1 OmpA family protein [Chitinophaga japonensis]
MSNFLASARVVCLAMTAFVLFASCTATKKVSQQQKYMNDQYRELKSALNEAEVSIIKDSIKVIFSNGVLFASSSDELKEDIKPAFERFAGVLNKYDKTKIIITGHTDNTGTDAYNRELSEKRAVSAKQLLATYQVAEDRMFTWGMEDREPLASNSTDEGRSRNRRVEFVILYNVKE